jgi:alpha-glucosidase
MCRAAGVVGAKVDFLDHEAKEVIDRYELILREAARNRIMVNFHGANKPTGRERTLPNDMVREAIKGMESSRLMDRAVHQTILPFTRYLAGGADYTTMIFSERRGDTTWANQIASLAIFNSPLLTIAANPQSIRDNPAVEVIKSIPSVWDATIVLPGSEIGELAAYARRAGDTWFVAAMCGPQPKTLEVPLSFLDEGRYQVSIVHDGDSDNSVTVEQTTKERNDSIGADLRAGGGFVARFVKQ